MEPQAPGYRAPSPPTQQTLDSISPLYASPLSSSTISSPSSGSVETEAPKRQFTISRKLIGTVPPVPQHPPPPPPVETKETSFVTPEAPAAPEQVHIPPPPSRPPPPPPLVTPIDSPDPRPSSPEDSCPISPPQKQPSPEPETSSDIPPETQTPIEAITPPIIPTIEAPEKDVKSKPSIFSIRSSSRNRSKSTSQTELASESADSLIVPRGRGPSHNRNQSADGSLTEPQLKSQSSMRRISNLFTSRSSSPASVDGCGDNVGKSPEASKSTSWLPTQKTRKSPVPNYPPWLEPKRASTNDEILNNTTGSSPQSPRDEPEGANQPVPQLRLDSPMDANSYPVPPTLMTYDGQGPSQTSPRSSTPMLSPEVSFHSSCIHPPCLFSDLILRLLDYSLLETHPPWHQSTHPPQAPNKKEGFTSVSRAPASFSAAQNPRVMRRFRIEPGYWNMEVERPFTSIISGRWRMVI